MFNSQVPHPIKKEKGLLIDYNLPVVMLPLVVSGVSFGYILNSTIPDVFICAIFASGLVVMAAATWRKAYVLRLKESTQLT
jgi:hypothetical protein